MRGTMRAIADAAQTAGFLILLASLPAGAQTQTPASEPAAASGPYKLVKTIDLPGGRGGTGGQIAFDTETAAVWLAQAPSKNVVVIETGANTVRQVIEGIENPAGICFSEHYAFVADTAANATAVIGKRSLEKATSLKLVGQQPDNVYFDTKNGALWIAASGGELTVYKAVGHGGLKRLAGLKLKPAPTKEPLGKGIYVASKDRIYQPVDDRIEVIDPMSRRTEHTWKVADAVRITSLSYDAKADRLIAGTVGKIVAVIDAKTGKELGKVTLKGEVGAVATDSGTRHAFAADRAGQIAVIDIDRASLAATIPSDAEVRALTLDPHSHFLYVYRDQANKVDVFAPRQ
jgi:DNA-binding beta-propeller fold protein YncE